MVALILVPVLLAAVIPAAAQDQAQLQPTPLSLLEALRLALQQNQQLKVAAFEVAVARAQLAQVRAGGAIQGNVQASYARTQEGVSTSIPFLGVLGARSSPSPRRRQISTMRASCCYTPCTLAAAWKLKSRWPRPT